MIANLQREQRQPLDLDQIRQDFPLPSVVASSGVKLIRAGNEYKACCPFHSDRSPSFTIFSGGAIRLAPCARSLVVCEGLEDGLSLQQGLGVAVWVAAGASMLPNMLFPPGVQCVAVGGDADDAGRAAARKAAEAFTFRGIESRVFFPVDAKDFNDELTQGARA